ncbi:hypothetical protein ACFWXO_30940 [Kitasatospora sp. NPDC059088]|uniref:hypothetical protein n=1 Tax=Kitasatospora sp. NPDC059088 TaxID=3346722 RepID=UPI0036B9E46F
MTTTSRALASAMGEHLLAALTAQNHRVDGHAATVKAIVRRELAERVTRQTASGPVTTVHLNPAGRRAAAEMARDLPDAAREPLWQAALGEARRLLRLGDDERVQSARWVLSTRADDQKPAVYGPFGVSRSLRRAAEAILAGAAFRRLDEEGLRVEATHLSGVIDAFVVIDDASVTAAQLAENGVS